eukprot:4600857-Alexandrium_andersonii.AAC.1
MREARSFFGFRAEASLLRSCAAFAALDSRIAASLEWVDSVHFHLAADTGMPDGLSTDPPSPTPNRHFSR